jgi:hypothetical protein
MRYSRRTSKPHCIPNSYTIKQTISSADCRVGDKRNVEQANGSRAIHRAYSSKAHNDCTIHFYDGKFQADDTQARDDQAFHSFADYFKANIYATLTVFITNLPSSYKLDCCSRRSCTRS